MEDKVHDRDLEQEGDEAEEENGLGHLQGGRREDRLGEDGQKIPTGGGQACDGNVSAGLGAVDDPRLFARFVQEGVNFLEARIVGIGDVKIAFASLDGFEVVWIGNEAAIGPEQDIKGALKIVIEGAVHEGVEHDVVAEGGDVTAVVVDGGGGGSHPAVGDGIEEDAGPEGGAGRVVD